MNLEKNIREIRSFLLKRYKDNLAAVLIFGSANTGHFIEGKSDIDNMIFLKKMGKINANKEIKLLIGKLKPYNFATQYFYDLKGIKEYVKKGKRFSSYITIIGKEGSRTLYTTSEFEKTRGYLKKYPPTRKKIKEVIREKDEFELYGYFKKIRNFDLTKALMSHLRRKLQIMNYFKTGKLIFDYKKCLRNIKIPKEEKKELMSLYEIYAKRKGLSQKAINYYRNLAEEFSKRIDLS